MQLFKMLFSLDGRINRRQFWIAFLIIVAVSSLLLVGARWLRAAGTDSGRAASLIPLGLMLFFAGWSLVAVSVKRWHDMGMSGLMTLIWLVPVIGPLFVIACLGFGPGNPHRHRRR